MSLVPNDVKNEWKNVATLLNSSSGGLGVVCTLIFEGGVESTANIAEDNAGIKPRVGLSFGGRSPARTITGQHTTDNKAESGQGLREKQINKEIDARIYAVTKDFERYGIAVSKGKGVWRVITKNEYLPDLMRCKEIILYKDLKEKRIRARLIKPPQPHGLGQAVQCKSFWEEV